MLKLTLTLIVFGMTQFACMTQADRRIFNEVFEKSEENSQSDPGNSPAVEQDSTSAESAVESAPATIDPSSTEKIEIPAPVTETPSPVKGSDPAPEAKEEQKNQDTETAAPVSQ